LHMAKLETRQIGQLFCLRKYSPEAQFWLAAQNMAPAARGWLRSVLLNGPFQPARVPFLVRRKRGGGGIIAWYTSHPILSLGNHPYSQPSVSYPVHPRCPRNGQALSYYFL
jgi:hypothetical protein